MSAQVVAYSADPQDEHLTLRIECRACGTQWGWGCDVPAAHERLEGMADQHNIEKHGHRRLIREEPR